MIFLETVNGYEILKIPDQKKKQYPRGLDLGGSPNGNSRLYLAKYEY